MLYAYCKAVLAAV